MLYMVVERFKPGCIEEVYRRFRERGRMAPAGVTYVNSWVTTDREHCYQVMECAHVEQLHEWASNWSDLVEFEFVPVVPSAEMSAQLGNLENA